jgi:superfamily II DNA/RNA helicase
VGESTPDITSAHHLFWNVSRHDRVATTAKAIDAAWPAIVFCRTRHGSDRVARQLSRDGIQAVALHGGRSQPQRTRALADFAGGRVHALIATDVAARGIHVEGVASVIHFDPPEDHKAYVHRSGRTARAGQGGVVVSLVQPEQVKDIRRIQRQAGMEELFTDPDAVALRRLSPPPARAATPATNAGDAVESQRADSSSSRRSSGSRRRPSHGRSAAGHSKGRPKAKNGKQTQNSKQRQSGKQTQSARKPQNGKTPQNAKQTQSAKQTQNAKQPQNGKPAQNGKKSGPKRNTGRGSSAKTYRGPNRKARRAHLQPGVNA